MQTVILIAVIVFIFRIIEQEMTVYNHFTKHKEMDNPFNTQNADLEMSPNQSESLHIFKCYLILEINQASTLGNEKSNDLYYGNFNNFLLLTFELKTFNGLALLIFHEFTKHYFKT